MIKLRMGMVGGGPGAFIGPVHRMAAELDGQIELVAGAFSADPAKSKAAGRGYGVEDDRAYGSYQEMLRSESSRDDRIDFVAIVTPNHLHLPIAAAALDGSFHVISDKPATATLEQARELREVVRRSRTLYALTHTYTGYPLVREARSICQQGDLGMIRKVVVEYSQGWLSEPLEASGQKQASWRCDPAQAGMGGCIGDIGVHAFNIVEFVTGLRISEVSGALSSVVQGRRLDDDCNVLLRMENGAPGVLHASQIAAGERNGLRLRVYGERGGLDWSQEDPNYLRINWNDRPSQILHGAGNAGYLSERTRTGFRLPLGHPEGYLEAFANIYRDFAAAVRKGGPLGEVVPSIEAGVRGMAFVAAAIESSASGSRWTAVAEP
jgi:predicted dehydrogenase